MIKVAWFAVDWGNSNLRIWCMDEQDNIVDCFSSDQGMLSMTPDQYEITLINILSPFLDSSRQIPVFACGAIGSRQGLKEIPYRLTPCTPLKSAQQVNVRDQRISLFIIPGLSQNNPLGIMRGEETQIGGVLSLFKSSDQILCLPGTHSKWVNISNGLVTEFRSAMTGELFSVLSMHSILKFSVQSDEFDLESFDEGVLTAKQRPAFITQALFSIRSQDLLEGSPAHCLKSRLSGLLIGIEIAGMADLFEEHEGDITVVGNQQLSSLYERALGLWQQSVKVVPSEVASLNGLIRLKERHDQRSKRVSA